ncbi:group I intron-associated PD-(D/E)XK endonuclease [Halosegnis marinus]|uniref:Group I intron-associated PD-(D/E)XK endonuclease n=1 Tax=Halosegnis marinus TaxID=3034023 RepID=A0ABD5ZPS5_9EURY|nr:group I intron-associated PD-(D/E)XK endonuclease [Halosegnis sp. DT85]
MWLRVEEPEQADASINWARDYEFDRNWPPEEGVASPTAVDDEVLDAVADHGVRAWLPADDVEGYDALVEAGDDVRAVRFERGWVVDDRVRFDTGGADESAAEREAVDDVLVYCAERDAVYAIARDASDETASFRVTEPKKPDSRIRRARDYRFAENWPTQTDS